MTRLRTHLDFKAKPVSIYTVEVSQESEERRTTHGGILRTVCELLGSDIPKKSVGRSVMLNIICPLVVHICARGWIEMLKSPQTKSSYASEDFRFSFQIKK